MAVVRVQVYAGICVAVRMGCLLLGSRRAILALERDLSVDARILQQLLVELGQCGTLEQCGHVRRRVTESCASLKLRTDNGVSDSKLEGPGEPIVVGMRERVYLSSAFLPASPAGASNHYQRRVLHVIILEDIDATLLRSAASVQASG